MSILPPVAGWYPAPDGSAAVWWWDGAKWAQSQPHPVAPRTIANLAVAIQSLLIVTAVATLAFFCVDVYGIAVVTDFLDGRNSSIELLDAYDQLAFGALVVWSLALLSTAVCWVLWQYRVAKRFTGRTRRVAGWHAGDWFIPVLSYWRPYQDIADLWRALGRDRPRWQIVWWILWVASTIMTAVANRITLTAVTLDQLRSAMWFDAVADLLLLVAVPFAWLVVSGITRLVAQPTKMGELLTPR